MFKLPDGRRLMPRLPPQVMAELRVQQFKLIQTTLNDVELHYVPLDDDAAISQDAAQRLIDTYISPAFSARSLRVNDIPRGPGGKFLMNESLVPEPEFSVRGAG